MDINEVKSTLAMNNLYFSECHVTRNAVLSKENMSVNISRDIDKLDEHRYDISVKVTAQNAGFDLLVVAKATFIFEGDVNVDEEAIVKTNTVAIMYPYVRSQITLMTSQPGMAPLVLPPINTSKLK